MDRRRWSSTLGQVPAPGGRFVVRTLRRPGSDNRKLAGWLPWSVSVRGALLAPEPGCLGERVCSMSQQVCLDCAQRRYCLPRRVRHGETGTTLKVVPHRLICRVPTQTLPLSHPHGCGRDRLAPSDAHAGIGCKKDANVAWRRGYGATAMPSESSTG